MLSRHCVELRRILTYFANRDKIATISRQFPGDLSRVIAIFAQSLKFWFHGFNYSPFV